MRKRDYIREEKIEKDLEIVAESKIDGILNNAIENGAHITKSVKRIIRDCYIANYLQEKEIVLTYFGDIMSEIDTLVYETNKGYPVSESRVLNLCEDIGETINRICRLAGVTNPDDV